MRFSARPPSLLRLALLGGCLLVPGAGRAAVTAKDIQVAGRVLGFTTTPPAGPLRMGIVYSPANEQSAAEAKALASILGTGLTIGDVTLLPVPIPINRLGQTPADLLFLTSGLGSAAASVGAHAEARKILCLTTDLAATEAGYCAVNVETDPKVKITVNRAASQASGIDFDAAFMLMINQI